MPVYEHIFRLLQVNEPFEVIRMFVDRVLDFDGRVECHVDAGGRCFHVVLDHTTDVIQTVERRLRDWTLQQICR